MAAWLFAKSTKRPEMPATSMAIVLLLTLVALLVMEPDFGQTVLVLTVWGTLFFIAGMRMIWVAGLAGAAAAGLFGAYLLVPHVAGRIKRSLNPASGDTFQVDMAMEAFWNGGWFGLGPGEGIAKRSLPDSHTDFVFAVAAEEFGIILAGAGFAVRLRRDPDADTRLCERGYVCALCGVGACDPVRRAGRVTWRSICN